MTDYLSRQPYLDLLKSIIENQKDNPTGYSFAIDGEWGSGKTWILQELEKQLLEEKNNKYLIFHYNAWENDFYHEPLVAILSVMIEKLNEVTSQKSLYEATVDELLKQVSNDLLTLTSGIVKEITKIDIEQIIRRKKGIFKRIKEDTKLTAKDINTMLPLKNTLEKVRNNLKKMADKVHVILVVDELDRCLPEYAIKVLERLHHICNEMPMIQVIAYSGKALANSVAQVFGGNISDEQSKKAYCSHYMEKFVRLILPLNMGLPDTNTSIMYEGVEQQFRPMFDGSKEFLINFYMLFLRGIPIRNRKQILETVKMIHELTLAANDFKNLDCTYELLCCEILLVIDRVLLHAQSPFNVKYIEKGKVLTLSFCGDEGSRYGEVINIQDFEKMIEKICVPYYKDHVLGYGNDLYSIHADTCDAIVFLIFANGKFISVGSEYSYLVGRPSVNIINESKRFIEKFYELLYQFVLG